MYLSFLSYCFQKRFEKSINGKKHYTNASNCYRVEVAVENKKRETPLHAPDKTSKDLPAKPSTVIYL